MSKAIRLLIVDDETEFLAAVEERLGHRGFDIVTADSGEAAIAASEHQKFDLALVDLQMPGMDGRTLLAALKERHRYLEVIMLTGHGSIDSAVECTKLGAFDYLTKPCPIDHLVQVLRAAYEHRLRRKFEQDSKRIEELGRIALGESPLGIMKRMRELDDDER
ncbi:MAG: response regulator [Candidatus Krumholzibacteriia bacterium]